MAEDEDLFSGDAFSGDAVTGGGNNDDTMFSGDAFSGDALQQGERDYGEAGGFSALGAMAH